MLNVFENITFDNRDEFKRKDFANKVIKLLRSDSDVSPLVIDGDWGIGKTEFCRKLVKLINTEYSGSLHAIYVDAFAEDYCNNPLISLLSVRWVSEKWTSRNNLGENYVLGGIHYETSTSTVHCRVQKERCQSCC